MTSTNNQQWRVRVNTNHPKNRDRLVCSFRGCKQLPGFPGDPWPDLFVWQIPSSWRTRGSSKKTLCFPCRTSTCARAAHQARVAVAVHAVSRGAQGWWNHPGVIWQCEDAKVTTVLCWGIDGYYDIDCSSIIRVRVIVLRVIESEYISKYGIIKQSAKPNEWTREW